ncbi:MAG: helix-turn-helix domain-containing protein [Bacteroidetes bacterium]|nr:helix-turn-helix domain-containing protein [Bacteroidota bacterium]
MNQDIADRLQIILNQKSLTASQFAEEIDVQRSSISHIISRRSKPSLDFIEKLCARFPDIDISWFISGKAATVVSRASTTEQTPLQYDLFGQPVVEPQISQSQAAQIPVQQVPQTPQAPEKLLVEKNIVKIITFFSDNSFQEFVPENLGLI